MTEENPYLNARKKHNEYESSRNASLRLWKLFGLLGLLTGLAGVGGMIHIGSQSKFVPYVIEVDKLGQTLPVSVADKAAPADPRIVSSLLARAITLARMVTPDVVVQRNAIFELYASLDSSDPAALKMQEYLGSDSETSPFKRAAKETVDVQITSVIPQSDETWQVDWLETVRARGDGSIISRFRMRALVRIYVVPPTNRTSEEQIRKNPLGIFIKDFNWSKQL
ncbi:VirB8/TrbF family protein [uncultured Bilophila sp.]|uniref:VirB8/TrbF family protein n=1 Tax=uncultured Bilophila sp. TaxID=529385 RepID=UPI00267008AA|nr:VirB8/TrbF family protein [uncultured Bilophila sp.]